MHPILNSVCGFIAQYYLSVFPACLLLNWLFNHCLLTVLRVTGPDIWQTDAEVIKKRGMRVGQV
jgi:hypothetical protein